MTDTETRVVNKETGAMKGQKLERFDLLPAEPLRQVARHYGIGSKKYSTEGTSDGDRNWERGYDWSLSYGAMQRHLNAFWNGEDLDEETQSPHLAAAGFHVLALLEFAKTHPELDDRPATKAKAKTPSAVTWSDLIQSWVDTTPIKKFEDFFESVPVSVSIPDPAPVKPGPHLHFEKPRPFQAGDRVQHHSGIYGTISRVGGLDGSKHWGDLLVDWDDGSTCGTLFDAIKLVGPKLEGRVSVRKIAKALGQVDLLPNADTLEIFNRDSGRLVRGLGLNHDDVVDILNALEDAGYEITHQK